MPPLPPLVVAFYADPDRYPPTFNAVRLLREHFRVTLICRNDAEPRSVRWPEDVRVERVGPALPNADKLAASPAAKVTEYLGFVAAVRRAVATEQPRVVYAYEPHALVAAMLAAPRARVVFHRHEVEEIDKSSPRSLQGVILRAALRLSRRAALLVFPEKNRAAYYLRLARDPRPPRVVPNFPLLASFPPIPALDEVIAARLADKVVFYRGAIGADNGIREAIGALAHLPAGVRLRMCGASSPAFVAEMGALSADLGVADRVRYEGFLPSFDALNRETARATVGVVLYQAVHTNWEHVGSATNKLYEYAACALPVVVPDRPSFREFLAGEEWVEYADASRPADVAAAIARILADPLRYAARCRAARRAFEERLNYEAAFAPLLEEVRRLAGA
jgi:glycosyltransferase involved in cell wall biosynthesis